MGETNARMTLAPWWDSPGAANRLIAWLGFLAGIVTGLLFGLWSFDGPLGVPSWLGAYGDTARRLARLGHIACFGIGFINLHFVRLLEGQAAPTRRFRTAGRLLNFGNIFLPATLFAAACYQPCKYLLPVPALAVTLGVALVVVGMLQREV